MPDRTRRLSADECVHSETLSAYVDGKLEVRERAQVTAHLASCSDCYDLVSEVLRIQKELLAVRPVMGAAPEVSAAPVPLPSGDTVVRGAFGRRKAIWGVAGVLAAAAAVVLVVRLQPTWWTGGVDPKLADLVDAVGEERTVEARLTGGFKHGPLRSPMRSGGRLGPTANWSLLAAAGRIREVAEKSSTPESLHAAGVASLLVGEYDEAVKTLEAVAARRAQDARVSSDLSAAYLARSAQLDQPDDLPRALAAAERSAAIDDSLIESWFNRALALERLHLRAQAIDAWTEYQQRDAGSPWRAESERRLAELRSER